MTITDMDQYNEIFRLRIYSSDTTEYLAGSSPSKARKARKATEDKDERQYSRAGSVKSSFLSSSSSAASQSQSRGGKRGRGKGNKDKGEENVRPNGYVEMADALLGSDVDMRVVVEKRDSGDSLGRSAPAQEAERSHRGRPRGLRLSEAS